MCGCVQNTAANTARNSQDLTKFKLETWLLSHSNAYIKVNNCLNVMTTVLFDVLSTHCNGYIK